MLTQVLLRYVLVTSLVVMAPAVLLVWILLGADVALALLVGGLLAVGDALGLIYLVGQIMGPSAGAKKALFAVLLIAKLTVVGILLWAAVQSGLSQLGIVLGIGVGLLVTVVGASRGSTSAAGLAAIAREERAIAEMGDNQEQSR